MKIYPTLLMAALLLASCSGKEQKVSETAEGQQTASADTTSASTAQQDSVTVDAVSSATNVANSPTFNGVLIASPTQMATVSSTMGGRIHKLYVMPGKAVSRGQVIALLDDPGFIELQQSYLEASAQLEYLEQEYNRQRSLGSKEAASQKRVQQSKAEYLAMKSKASATGAQLRALGINPLAVKSGGIKTYLPVTSPIGGFVTNLTVNLGKYVEAGSAICDVINKSQPLIQLTVYEKDRHLIEAGTELSFRVNGMGKSTFSATVISVDQTVDKTDYSIKAYAKVKDHNAMFRPGMYVRARMRQ